MAEKIKYAALRATTFAGQFYGSSITGREHAESVALGDPACMQSVQASGYDAMIQLRSSAMKTVLGRDMGGTTYDASRALVELGPEDQAALYAAVASEVVEAEVVAWPLAPRRVRVELEPHQVRTRIDLSRVHVAPGPDPLVTITMVARVSASARETVASHESRVDAESFSRAPPPFRDRLPPEAERVELELELGTVTLEVQGRIELEVDADRYRAEARFPFADARISMAGGRWSALVELEASNLIPSWGRRRLAPPVQFFGDPPTSSVPDITRFEARAIGTSYRFRGESWLTLCFEMTPGDTAASRAAIEPFTGERTAAVFLSEPVVVATVLSRWPTIPNRSIEVDVPLRVVMADGDHQNGVARVRYRVGAAESASIGFGSEDVADNVEVASAVVSQALRAEFRGEDITAELGDLTRPSSTDQLFRVFARSSGVEQTSRVAAWLSGIGRHVFTPALKPLAAPWNFRETFEAELSASLSSLVCRGDLT